MASFLETAQRDGMISGTPYQFDRSRSIGFATQSLGLGATHITDAETIWSYARRTYPKFQFSVAETPIVPFVTAASLLALREKSVYFEISDATAVFLEVFRRNPDEVHMTPGKVETEWSFIRISDDFLRTVNR